MFIFITILFFIISHEQINSLAVETKSVIRGQSTTLTCPIDIESCGELHSIKWFKGTERIGVASGDGKFSQVEGSFSDRYNVLYDYSDFHPLIPLSLNILNFSFLSFPVLSPQCSLIQIVNRLFTAWTFSAFGN